MSRPRVTNLTAFHAELLQASEGFTLEFSGWSEGGLPVRVKIHLETYFLQYLPGLLWKAISAKQQVLDEAKSAMVREEP